MSAKIWLGFGGCKFEANGITATFSGGSGDIGFDPIQTIKENANFNFRSRTYGFHVDIVTKMLYNLDDTDYVQFENLAQILSYLVSDSEQRYITITPRYDTNLTNNLNYDCILVSKITPQDLHRIKLGQVMQLSFKVLAKQDSIPTFTSDSEGNTYWDGTTTYWDGTTTYYDGLG